MHGEKVIYARVPEEVHSWLMTLASQQGISLGEMASQLLTEAFSEAVAAGNYQPKDQVLQYYLQFTRRTRQREMVLEMARLYALNPTEAAADMLRSACEAAGIPLEEILRVVKDEPVLQSVAAAENSKMARCIRWLRDVFINEAELPANTVLRCAAERGFSNWMCNQAKSKLGIRSVRRPDGWYWVRGPELEKLQWQEPVSGDE